MDFPWKKLNLDEMVTGPDGRHYLFFFDVKNMCILHSSPDLVAVPDHVVLVKIPDEMGLDPVGLARNYGLGDEYFLKMHPFDPVPSAQITPLENSGLLEFVAENRKRIRESHFG